MSRRVVPIVQQEEVSEDLKRQLHRFRLLVQQREQQLHDATEFLREKDHQVRELEERLKAKSHSLDDLEHGLQDRYHQISELEETLRQRETELHRLDELLHERDQSLVDLQRHCTSRENQLEKLIEFFQRRSSQLMEARKHLSVAGRRNQYLKRDLWFKRRAIERLRQVLVEKDSALRALRPDYAEFQRFKQCWMYRFFVFHRSLMRFFARCFRRFLSWLAVFRGRRI